MRLVIFFLALCWYGLTFGQEYQFIRYRVLDGLPTDVVKGVIQDSLGFMWIATDEGIARFDGSRFVTYKGALHSQYAKAFAKQENGSIFLIGDLDLVRIDNLVDTVNFVSILMGTRNPTDSTLWYPKSIYLKRDGECWIGEPQSVTLLKGNSMRRFPFGKEDLTPQFLRSFSFFEDARNTFYCVSYFGRVYRFNPKENKFELSGQFPSDVNKIERIDNTLWVISEDGVYSSVLNREGGFTVPQKKYAIPGATCIQPLTGGRYFIGTTSDKQYIVHPGEDMVIPLPYDIKDVSSVYLTDDNDLWISTSDGLVLLQENLFNAIKADGQERFIESIAEDTIGNILYYATTLDLFASRIIDGVPAKPKLVLSVPRGYFQSLQANHEGLWASNRYHVYLIRNEKIVRSWDFESEGRFIFDLFLDSKGNVWLSQDGTQEAKCITSDLQIKRYAIPLGAGSGVNVIRESESGILAGSAGSGNYLFFKGHEDSVFRNISVPISFPVKSDLSVSDIAVNGGVVWIASSEGLLKYDYKTIEKVVLGNFNPDFAVRTIESLKDGEILFNYPMGIVRYRTSSGEWWLYSEGNGLPSNNVVARGIYLGAKKRVFVGTSLGLAYTSGRIDLNQKSNEPFVTQAFVNGSPQPLTRELHIPHGSYLTLLFSPNIYPKNKVNIQYKLRGLDKEWVDLTGTELNITDRPSGNYTLEIRAKKTGGYDWSDTREFTFVVEKPFWQTFWFIGSSMLLVAFVGGVSYQVAKSVNRRRRDELEKLVKEITEKNEEIQAQSEILTESNNALHRLNVRIAEQREEIQAQAEELIESNQVINKLNDHLQDEVEKKSYDLVQTNEELVRHNNELLQFSYTVSHNLRGPVARILGINNLIALSDNAGERENYLQLLNQVALDLDSVLKDLNLIIDTRNAVFKVRERIRLEDEWQKCLSLLEDYIFPDFVIKTDFSEEPYVYSIRAMIQNVFYNLLSNAIKYRSPDRQLKISVRSFTKDGYVGIEVNDNGLGIDLNRHGENVFKLYRRFHTHVAGKGLGLYLMKTQIEVLKGKIQLNSALNVGTTFTILVPGMEDIQNQMFFENECAQLYYDARTNCINIVWKRTITTKEYRETYETLLQTVRVFHSPGWIADLRNQGTVDDSDRVWFLESVLPEAARYGLRRNAIIRHQDHPNSVNILRGIEQAKELGIEARIFDSMEEAKVWMQAIFPG